MKFLMFNLGEKMKLELYSDPETGCDKEILLRARDFAKKNLDRHAEDWERDRAYPETVVREAMAEFGDLLIPTRLGGKGATTTTFFHVLEEFARKDIGFSIAFVVQCNLGLIVSMSENASLRDHYLPRLMNGTLLGAFCLTEPHAGSDAGAITTLATSNDDGYSINGTKSWIINAQHAEVVGIFAKTDADAGTKGIALFLADTAREGVSRSQPYELISGNVTHVGDVAFDHFQVRQDEMLFGPGAGFRAAMQALDAARIGIAAICNGALASGLDYALDYAGQREAFGSALLTKQGFQWCFADHLTQLEASRLLTFRAAAMLDRGEGTSVIGAHAKKFANHAVVDGLVWAMRSMGANGTRRSHPLARQLASAQLLFHTDGTPEILNLVIGRSLVRARTQASKES